MADLLKTRMPENWNQNEQITYKRYSKAKENSSLNILEMQNHAGDSGVQNKTCDSKYKNW